MIKAWAPWILATAMLAGCNPEEPSSQGETNRPVASASTNASANTSTNTSTGGASVATPYVYTCSDLRFTARFEADAAVLTFPDRELRLPQALSGSGARYSDGTTTFWIKGDEATLEIDGRTTSDCRAEGVETSP